MARARRGLPRWRGRVVYTVYRSTQLLQAVEASTKGSVESAKGCETARARSPSAPPPPPIFKKWLPLVYTR
eukprot:1178627-Prorocentrum_minimum.AAC.10